MHLVVRYRADYDYVAPASLSTHVLRIFPRPCPHTVVLRQAFSTVEGASVQFRRDLFDNVVATAFFPDLLTTLPVRLELELEVRERNPFDFLLEPRGLQMPCAYTDAERRVLGPFLAVTRSVELPAALAPTVRPTVDGIVAMNRWIAETIRYERRDEGDALPAQETLRRGAGACRDVAVLFAETLRCNGVAARLVSGFVFEGDADEGDRRAASAMHAWVEAYLPGAGWVGLDPTHGVLCDHCFVPTAVGLKPAEIAPLSGDYFSDVPVESRLTTAVMVARP